jgi:redox-sensitive bicupin YhaK (pirin superfamily)
MSNNILQISPLGFPWKTQDPFLFCVYHEDFYPRGNENMGPSASLSGRNIGHDFTIKDGWRMYHGTATPGFPAHPHRGFETVTIAQKGIVDHSDSLGATARFGNGDVQWMTAGIGVQHAEMFPLLNEDRDNPFELFQIWLNLPSTSKKVPPYFGMLWSETIPHFLAKDEAGRSTDVKIIAGNLQALQAPAPPPDSWASHPDHDVAIWVIKMEPDAAFGIPPASSLANRSLYYYKGDGMSIEGQSVSVNHAIDLASDQVIVLKNGATESHLLLLQGRPINEPVVQYGPFVMNSQQEIQQAMLDFQRTQFGGWPWPSYEHVHPREKGRFAIHADGRVEEKNIDE